MFVIILVRWSVMPIVQKEFRILKFDKFKMKGIHDFKD